MDRDRHRASLTEADGKIAGLYDLQDTIGRGHFAVVKLAQHVFTGEKVAVKVIDKTKLDDISKEHLFQEVMCMKLVQHPHVVRLYEVIDTANKLYLVLELGDGGDLYDYIMKHEKGLSEDTAKRYFRQIVTAIAYCHKLHVVHRDLKPENVVFFEKLGLVKLTDFGFSNKFIPGQPLETSCGSLAYSAPEILLGDSYDAPKVDIWSLGVILYMLVCGQLPFQEANDSETLAKIMDCDYRLPLTVSVGCRQLIKRLLIRDPEGRAVLDEILQDEWLKLDDDNSSLETFSVPLISQENLGLEDHMDIMNKMAEGNLASLDEIQSTLDRNEYNYITATYFLLAERKLKRNYVDEYKRLMKTQQLRQLQILGNPATSMEGVLPTPATDVPAVAPMVSQSSVRVLEQVGTHGPEERMRRFSMILEDEEDHQDEEEEINVINSLASVRLELEESMSKQESRGGSGIVPPHPSRCCSRSSGGINTDVSDGGESDVSTGGGSFRQKTKHRRPVHHRPLVSVKSSPQLLKNITEEDLGVEKGSVGSMETQIAYSVAAVFGGKDDSFITSTSAARCSPRGSNKARRSSLSSPTHFRRFRRSSGPVGATSRSSSDNSDNEAETCGTTTKRFFNPFGRQDSDHSSDTDCSGKGLGVVLRSKNSGSIRSNRATTSGSNSSSGNGAVSGSHRTDSAGVDNASGPVDGTIANGLASLPPTLREVVCAPIREEEEYLRSAPPVDAPLPTNTGVPVAYYPPLIAERRRRSESADCTPARSSFTGTVPVVISQKVSNFSLSSTLTQSNFSLSSLASSMRGSKMMMDVIRGTFELQCQAQQRKATRSSVHSEITSVQSLPAEDKRSSTRRDIERATTLDYSTTPRARAGINLNNNNAAASPTASGSKKQLTSYSQKPRVKLTCCKVS